MSHILPSIESSSIILLQKDPALLEATASEPLSIEEEYEMQASWAQDETSKSLHLIKKTFRHPPPSSTDLSSFLSYLF
jgi:hypothetical protein